MQQILTPVIDGLYSFFKSLDNFVWGWAMIVLLL